jgi:hypothetical protein
MPNVFKYSPGATAQGCLYEGGFLIGNNTIDYGLSFYNGITPGPSGFTIYVNKASQGPSIVTPPDEQGLLYWANLLSGQNFVTGASGLAWFSTQTDKICVNRDYEGIITQGLTLNLDAGFTPSYPTGGTGWNNISSPFSVNSGTLINGPTYSSQNSGTINFDGIDDYVDCGIAEPGQTQCTISIWVKTTSTSSGTRYPFAWGTSSGFYASQNLIGVFSGGSQLFVLSRDSTATTTTQVNSIGFTLNDGIWHNIVLVRDGSTISLYIDGSLNNSSTGGAFGSFSSDAIINIGNYPLLDAYFEGSIGKILVYGSTALSASQITTNWNASKSIYGR